MLLLEVKGPCSQFQCDTWQGYFFKKTLGALFGKFGKYLNLGLHAPIILSVNDLPLFLEKDDAFLKLLIFANFAKLEDNYFWLRQLH
jgi:hypothetical protein